MKVPGLAPFEMMDRMMNPTALREAMVRYLCANDCPVVSDALPKSLGTRVLFHQINPVVGINQFFKGTPVTSGATTSSNMVNSFQLPQGEHMIITAIRIMNAIQAAATLATADWTFGASSVMIKNGNFDLSANGINWLKAMPGSRACEDITSAELGFVVLEVPIVWPAQCDLLINYNILTAPTADTAMRIEVHGFGFLS